MVIYGRRVVLHDFSKSDAFELYKYRSKKEVERFQSFKNYSLEEAKQAVLLTGPKRKPGNYQLGIYVNRQLIGDLFIHITNDYHCYIGYTIDSLYWKQGYGFESCQLCIRYLSFYLDIHHFYAYIESLNQASIGLIRKLGFNQINQQLYYLYV